MKSAATSLVRSRTQRLALHLLFVGALLVLALPASAGNALGVNTASPGNGQTVSGSITWEVTVSSGNVGHVDFAIDGAVKWTENVAPWQYNGVAGGLNTTQLSDGTHQLTAKAYSKNGKAAGSSTVAVTVSNATAPPPPPPPPPSPSSPPTSATLPSITGTPIVGQTLSASIGAWSGSTPMTHSYGWVRCASSGGNCSPISGATSATYAAASADVGSTIRVTVTASNIAGSATATSAATAVVTQEPGVPASPPTNLGTSLPARMPESSGSSTLYVSTTGNDSNAGTLASPLKTLSKAFGLATSGSIINLRGGNYGPQFVNQARFPSTDPVTIQSYPGEAATFVGQTAYTNAVSFTNDKGIRLRNLTFAARTNVNLKVVSSQNIEVDQILSKDSGRGCDPNSTATCGGQGLLVVGEEGSGYAFPYSDDIQIWNSEFFNNGGTNTAGQSHDHPIYMCSSGASYGAGTNNGCHSFVIANNVIHENPTGYGVQLGDQAQNGFVVNNTFDRQGIPSAGLNYAGCGIMVWSSGTFGTHDVLIANNIFTNGVANPVCSSLGKSPTGNMVRNNLAFNNGTNCNFTGCQVAYSSAYGSYTGFAIGANLPNADPKYVSSTGNYRLQTTSPALGKSDPAYTPPLDADGLRRPAAPALGPYG